jgi:hypothetical protein
LQLEPGLHGEPERDRGLDGRRRAPRQRDEAREDGLASDRQEESFDPPWRCALDG